MTNPKPPTTENRTANEVSTLMSSLENAGVVTVENLIIADVPWLGAPVIKQIWQALFAWIAGYFLKAAQDGATFVVIDAQISSEEFYLSEALAKLMMAEKTGDPNAIQIAIKNYADAQSELVHSDGSSSIH